MAHAILGSMDLAQTSAPGPTLIRGSEAVLQVLRSEDVRYVFGNPGTTELPLLESLADAGDIRYVLALHEAVAAGMADGYAQATGRPSFVNLVRLVEARTWLDRALAEGSPGPDTRYWLLWSIGLVAAAQGDVAAARAANHEALALCEARSDLREMSRITALYRCTSRPSTLIVALPQT